MSRFYTFRLSWPRVLKNVDIPARLLFRSWECCSDDGIPGVDRCCRNARVDLMSCPLLLQKVRKCDVCRNDS